MNSTQKAEKPQDRLRRFIRDHPMPSSSSADDGAAGLDLVREVCVVPERLARQYGFPPGQAIEKWTPAAVALDDAVANTDSRGADVSGAAASLKDADDAVFISTGRISRPSIPVPLPGSPSYIHYHARSLQHSVVATTLDYVLLSPDGDDNGIKLPRGRQYVGGTDDPAALWLFYHDDPVSRGAWLTNNPVANVSAAEAVADDSDGMASVVPPLLHFAVSTMRAGEVARFNIPAISLSTPYLATWGLRGPALADSGEGFDGCGAADVWVDVCLERCEEPLPPPPSLARPSASTASTAGSISDAGGGGDSENEEAVLELPTVPSKSRKEVLQELRAFRATAPPPLQQRLLSALILKDDGNAAFKADDLDTAKRCYDGGLAQCFVGRDEWLYSQHDDAEAPSGKRFGLSDLDKRRLGIVKLQLHSNRAAVHLKRCKGKLAHLASPDVDGVSARKLIAEGEKATLDALWDCDQALALLPSTDHTHKCYEPLSGEERALLKRLAAPIPPSSHESDGGSDGEQPRTLHQAAFLGIPLTCSAVSSFPPFDYLSSRYRLLIRKSLCLLEQASLQLAKGKVKEYWDEDKCQRLIDDAETLLKEQVSPLVARAGGSTDEESKAEGQRWRREVESVFNGEITALRRRLRAALERTLPSAAASSASSAASSAFAGAFQKKAAAPSKGAAPAGMALVKPQSTTADAGAESAADDGDMPPLLDC